MPIEGVVSFKTVALIRRGMSEATGRGAKRVVLDINTPGGLIDSMEEVVSILSQLRSAEVETVAYVSREALSAGAVISIACTRIFMADNATIGAAVPVFAGGMKGVLEDEVREKYLSAFRADVRRIGEEAHPQNPNIGLLASAMVDQRIRLVMVRWRGKDGVMRSELMADEKRENLKMQEGIEILAEEPIGGPGPLTLTTKQAQAVGLCESTPASVEELMRELGVAPYDFERLEPTWSEELASFLHGLRMFLLIGGVLMAVVAFKTPGTGVPEALSLLCFIAFFAGSWLVGLAAVTEVLLFAGGIGLILVELFVIPGTIVSGFIGFLMVVSGLFFALQPFTLPGSTMEGDVMEHNLLSLLLTILIVIAGAIILSRFLPKVPFFNRLLLEPKLPDGSLETTATDEKQHSPLLGKLGAAITDLRPAGRAEIDGEPIDVVAQAAFVEKGQRVKVVKVEGNRVIVDPARRQDGQIDVIWLAFILFLGLLFVVAEVFFPSGGILGVIAAVMSIGSVFMAFQHGPGTGITFLIAVGILLPATVVFAFWWLDKSRWGRRIILSGPTFDPKEHKVRGDDLEAFVGGRAIAVTPLRPSGSVEIDGRKLDAMTRGEIIEPGTEVEVIRVELSQLVVAAAKAEASAKDQSTQEARIFRRPQ